jgi:hypothetical protein
MAQPPLTWSRPPTHYSRLAKLNGGSPVQVPDDLEEQVAKILDEFPTVRWDQAVASILDEDE